MRTGAAIQGGRDWANATIIATGGTCILCAGPLPVGRLALLWRRFLGHPACVFTIAARRMQVEAADGTIVLVPNPDHRGLVWTPPTGLIH